MGKKGELHEVELTKEVIGAMIEVHRHLGPGLLEPAYGRRAARELELRQIPSEAQKPLALEYKGVKLDCGYRLDLLVAGRVIVEIKAVDQLGLIHEAQLLTYMRLARVRGGLLANFNVPVLKDGTRRLVL